VAEVGGQPFESVRPEAVSGPRPAAEAIEVAVTTVDERAVVLHVVGEVDMLTAPVFAEHVRTHFAAAGQVRPLVVDVTGVTFLGSAGLAVLADARNLATASGVAVRVVASSPTVLRPLQVTGLDQVLEIVPDVTTALSQVTAT
jgi:anti-anti-sigma factor